MCDLPVVLTGLSAAVRDELAQRLHTARGLCQEVARLTVEVPALTLADAYAIQASGIALRQAAGERVVAYKMGLTSAGKRQQMGLDAPVYGVLTDTMLVSADQPLVLSGGIHPKVEPEIAFLLRTPLRAGMDRASAWQCVAGVAPALEILDSRYIGFKYFSLPDVVADNSSSWRYAVGAFVAPELCDPADLAMEMTVDGRVVATGRSAEISGDPVASLVQLGDLAELYGLQVPAGAVVLSGAATPAFALTAACEVWLDVAGLERLRLSVVA